MGRLKSDCRGTSDTKYNGLRNQGSTCYLNSVLQVFFMTKDFRKAVMTSSERFLTNNLRENPYIDLQLTTLFKDLSTHTAETVDVTQKLGIIEVNEQRDAAEYFEKILTLASTDASLIFQGRLTHLTVCSGCSTKSDETLPFWNLPLALMNSNSGGYRVVDGVREFFKVSEFHGENQIYCDNCCDKFDATARCEVTHHPEVLVLLLKRFEFNYYQMSFVKNSCTVIVPYTLTVPENQTYEIYAFVEHFGSLKSGHYTATIKSQDNKENRWYNFNDSTVRPLYEQPFQNDNTEKSKSAYLLFYRKKNTASVDDGEVPINEGLPSDTNKNYDQCQHATKRVSGGDAAERDEETETESRSNAMPSRVGSPDLLNRGAQNKGAHPKQSRPNSYHDYHGDRTVLCDNPVNGDATQQRKHKVGMGGEAEAGDRAEKKTDEIEAKRRKGNRESIGDEQGHAQRYEGKKERTEAERLASRNDKQLNKHDSVEYAKDKKSVSSGKQDMQKNHQVSKEEINTSVQTRHQQGDRKMDILGGNDPKTQVKAHPQRARTSVTKPHQSRTVEDQGKKRLGGAGPKQKEIPVDKQVKRQIKKDDDEQNQITEDPLPSETGSGILASENQGAGSEEMKDDHRPKRKKFFSRIWQSVRGKMSKKHRGDGKHASEKVGNDANSKTDPNGKTWSGTSGVGKNIPESNKRRTGKEKAPKAATKENTVNIGCFRKKSKKFKPDEYHYSY